MSNETTSLLGSNNQFTKPTVQFRSPVISDPKTRTSINNPSNNQVPSSHNNISLPSYQSTTPNNRLSGSKSDLASYTSNRPVNQSVTVPITQTDQSAWMSQQAALLAQSQPPSYQSTTHPTNQSSSYIQAAVPSDSEWEECVVLRDGKRYPVAAHEKHINTVALLAILYLSVTGGPYGLEDGVKAGWDGGKGGVGWIMLLMIGMPLVFHWPIALLTSELASAMPQNGGYIIWVSRAFGNFWGYQEGWLSWAGAVVDAAIYPFLVISYLQSAFQETGVSAHWSGTVRLIVHCSVTAIFALIGIIGKQLSGTPSLMISIAFMLPFFILSLVGLSAVTWDSSTAHQLLSFPMDLDRQQWGLMLSSVLWVGAGWDSAGSVGNDVKQPRTTYPRAISLALIAVTITHLLPLIVAVLTDHNYADYNAMHEFWYTIAGSVSGPWLANAVLIASIVGNAHMFHVLFTMASWSLYALFLPGLLDVEVMTSIHPKYETPVYCIVMTSIVVASCGLLTFDRLLQLTMAFNSLALLLQCFSLIHLRITEPKMRRPYRIGLSIPVLALFIAAPILISIALLLTIDPICQIFVVITVIVGVVSYYVARWSENERRLHEHHIAFETGTSGYESASHVFDAREYESSDMAAPSQPAPVNLADVFAEEEDTTDIGFRTSVLADALPDFMTPQTLLSSRSFNNPSTLPYHDEGDEDDTDDETARERRFRMGLRRSSESTQANLQQPRMSFSNNLLTQSLSRMPIMSSSSTHDEDSASPVQPQSPVLLRSPKDASRRLSNR